MEIEEYYDLSVEIETRKNGRHIIIIGDAPIEEKRMLKYKIFSHINSDNYENLLKTLPKE